MKRSGIADLPLHHGTVPPWLAARMQLLGGAIVEVLVHERGRSEVLQRLSDPCWFQALGCVLGMDWHSSGITTSVMGALKRAITPRAAELGIYICGGRGRHSRKTPQELLAVADRTGLDGHHLVRCSRLGAKIDNTSIQDGFQIYLHNFIVTQEGEWAIVQQGMNATSGQARRYHWHSSQLDSFVEDPHTAVCGTNQGPILNLTAPEASATRNSILEMAQEDHHRMLREIRQLAMPSHHEVRSNNVDLKRLGSVLALAQDQELMDFESVLLLKGLGPRTLQSLVLVSEVIYGTPSRFSDPARFSFAHGGKDGHPFPVPTKVYDETIATLRDSLVKARIGRSEKQQAIRNLSTAAERLEAQFTPTGTVDALITHEKASAWKHGGRTVSGHTQPLQNPQLRLF